MDFYYRGFYFYLKMVLRWFLTCYNLDPFKPHYSTFSNIDIFDDFITFAYFEFSEISSVLFFNINYGFFGLFLFLLAFVHRDNFLSFISLIYFDMLITVIYIHMIRKTNFLSLLLWQILSFWVGKTTDINFSVVKFICVDPTYIFVPLCMIRLWLIFFIPFEYIYSLFQLNFYVL